MTKEEAISAFKEWIKRDEKMEYADRLENIEIYNRALQALDKEPCEDAIGRLDLRDAISNLNYWHANQYGELIPGGAGDYATVYKANDVERMADTLPSVTPTPKDDVLDKIRAEIESNMESIIGKYDSSIPKSNMPSYKIERNKARKECISIIDKYKADKWVDE